MFPSEGACTKLLRGIIQRMQACAAEYVYMHRHKLHIETVLINKIEKDTSVLQVSTTAFSISHCMSSPLDQPRPPTGQLQQ